MIIHSRIGTYRSEDCDGVTGLDGGRGLGVQSQDGEGLDWELGVLGRARHDKLRGERVNLVEGERGVEGLREGHFAVLGADVSAVAGLDSEDGAGGSQVVLVHDVGGSAEVSGHTDAL